MASVPRCEWNREATLRRTSHRTDLVILAKPCIVPGSGRLRRSDGREVLMRSVTTLHPLPLSREEMEVVKLLPENLPGEAPPCESPAARWVHQYGIAALSSSAQCDEAADTASETPPPRRAVQCGVGGPIFRSGEMLRNGSDRESLPSYEAGEARSVRVQPAGGEVDSLRAMIPVFGVMGC